MLMVYKPTGNNAETFLLKDATVIAGRNQAILTDFTIDSRLGPYLLINIDYVDRSIDIDVTSPNGTVHHRDGRSRSTVDGNFICQYQFSSCQFLLESFEVSESLLLVCHGAFSFFKQSLELGV